MSQAFIQTLDELGDRMYKATCEAIDDVMNGLMNWFKDTAVPMKDAAIQKCSGLVSSAKAAFTPTPKVKAPEQKIEAPERTPQIQKEAPTISADVEAAVSSMNLSNIRNMGVQQVSCESSLQPQVISAIQANTPSPYQRQL